MTQAVTVRRDGDAFQARHFWLHAARLLDDESPVRRVGFESGPKSFDDGWIEYEPSRGPLDAVGEPLRRQHLQCKWHVSPGSYGYADLVEPEFINASARSFLRRAHDAWAEHAQQSAGVRFKLVTNWRVGQDDPLRKMIGERSSTIRIDRLYGSSTDNSGSGRVRKAWREHLELDEANLRSFVTSLAFGHTGGSLDDLRDDLDRLFMSVGIQRVPPRHSAFIYDQLVFEWMAQGKLDFDRASFKDACMREGLLEPRKGSPRVYGVKSFEHPIDQLEERCQEVLNLVPTFDERFIRDAGDWEATLYPELRRFLLSAAQAQPRLQLVLDAHATLAFAAGSVLNIKSGRQVDLEQRTTDRRLWAADDMLPDPAWPKLEAQVFELDVDRTEIAVAVGLTHDVFRDVRHYVESHLPSVGRVLHLKPSTGPGARSVICGRHAFDLADAVSGAIRSARFPTVPDRVHLFLAAPNAFTFFLGQRQPAIGPLQLYEFDFEGDRDGSYAPSISLPIL